MAKENKEENRENTTVKPGMQLNHPLPIGHRPA
jgi:hypothetical protein